MTTPYAAAGVDTDRAREFLRRLLASVSKTRDLRAGSGRSVVDFGAFAAVLDLGRGQGLAITTDGVGSKILLAERLGRYDTIGIDCVAMNVNDLLCVGAEPIAMVDYVALEETDPEVGEQLGRGLLEGARQAGITIPGGEIAQLPEIVRGVEPGKGLDLAGTAVGLVDLSHVVRGEALGEGDVVVAISSSGLHSNGYTLARRVLLDEARLPLDRPLPGQSRPLGDELLEPTRIYVPHVGALRRCGVTIKAMVHVTGDGLFNLNRVQADVGYVLDRLPPPTALFDAIQSHGSVPPEEMYRVFNMGIGFCVMVPEAEARTAIEALAPLPGEAWVLGRVVADPDRRIHLPGVGLVGRDGRFFRA